MKAWLRQNLGRLTLIALVVAFVATFAVHKKSDLPACPVTTQHDGTEVAVCTVTNPHELRIRDSSKQSVRLTWNLSGEDVCIRHDHMCARGEDVHVLGNDVSATTFSVNATKTSSYVAGFSGLEMSDVASTASEFLKTPRRYQLNVTATPEGDGGQRIGLRVNFG
jgi:hypothetical protein